MDELNYGQGGDDESQSRSPAASRLRAAQNKRARSSGLQASGLSPGSSASSTAPASSGKLGSTAAAASHSSSARVEHHAEKHEAVENHPSHYASLNRPPASSSSSQHSSGSSASGAGPSASEARKNYVIVALSTALIVVGILWLANAFGGGSGVPTGAPVAGDDFGADAPAPVVNLEIGDSPVLGDADAPVTIFEFSDYQCPFCARFWSDTLPQITQQYIATGKVKIVFKDFPLDQIHPYATPAAHAARCAGEQGKYWEFHDKIFANQQLLSASPYQTWAGELGLDTAAFSQCVSSNKYLGAIRNDLQEGSGAGIQGTPGFIVNGQLVSGAQPFSVFQQIIEASLKA